MSANRVEFHQGLLQTFETGASNARRFLLWRFPFSVIYSESDSVITIWAVAHGSRQPEYWTRRLP